MDVDLESVEIVFAQKLACGEPPVRARALRALQNWIKEQSTQTPFSKPDFMRLCKGLHYVLWMQDKMLLHEELADKIANLIENFGTEEQRVLYFESILRSLAKEWRAIDRWRMDKFLLLIRRCVRVVFHYLQSKGWKKKVVDQYIGALQRTVISTDETIPEGLKSHMVSIYLDELDLAGGASKETVHDLLLPYVALLAERKLSKYLFSSILNELFDTILLHYTKELEEAKMEEDEEAVPLGKIEASVRMDEALEGKEGIQFDYAKLGKALFEVGKSPECISERRKKLYQYAKKYELAAAGKEPLAVKEFVPEIVLTEEMFNEATENILKSEEGAKAKRKEFARAKKIRPEQHAMTVAPMIVRDNTDAKARKKLKMAQKEKKKDRIRQLTEAGQAKTKKAKPAGRPGKSPKSKAKGKRPRKAKA
ncbi:unnamed protein product, partial [Mesorhabditis spiculigera]